MKPHMININIHQSGQGILLEVFGCLFKVDNMWHLQLKMPPPAKVRRISHTVKEKLAVIKYAEAHGISVYKYD